MLVLRKHRESDVKAISDSFLDYYYEDKGITKVTLTMAENLSTTVENKILNQFKTQTGLKNIDLTRKVDQSIFGGFVLEYEDKVLDASVKSPP